MKSWVSFTRSKCFVSKSLDEQEEVDGIILLYMCGVSELVVWISNQHHVNSLLFKSNANHISVCLNLIQKDMRADKCHLHLP